MRAGMLRETVEVEQYDGAAWNVMGKVGAGITEIGGADGGASLNFEVVLRASAVTRQIRAVVELKPTHRLVWGATGTAPGRILDVFEVVTMGKRRDGLRLQCREVLAEPE